MTLMNKQWVLASRPQGALSFDNFALQTVPAPGDDLRAGEIMVQTLALLCAPTTRNWMNGPGHYYPSIPLGSPIMGPAIARIVKSANPGFPVGRNVFTVTGWQEYAVLDPDSMFAPGMLFPEGVEATKALALLGPNALAAYFGVIKVCEPRSGETMVVSGAAGSTGSMAAQIGKIMGARVIGIAGGAEKCNWLLKDCRLDGVIDYKRESVTERLAEMCPKGVDVFFDNVGGDILQAVIDNIAIRGRIALCGQISGYNGDEKVPGPHDMMRFVYGRVKMQGFIMNDWASEADKAMSDIDGWVRAGDIKHREDVRLGFENLPKSFLALFDGSNNGTLLVKVADA